MIAHPLAPTASMETLAWHAQIMNSSLSLDNIGLVVTGKSFKATNALESVPMVTILDMVWVLEMLIWVKVYKIQMAIQDVMHALLDAPAAQMQLIA